MDEKNNIQDFLKWYFKCFFLLILFVVILTWLIYLYTHYESKEDKYYNNYYEINKDKLEEIKDYVINNNLEGYVYLYWTKWLWDNYTFLKQYDGKLWNHCINNKCVFNKLYYFLQLINNMIIYKYEKYDFSYLYILFLKKYVRKNSKFKDSLNNFCLS